MKILGNHKNIQRSVAYL